jgi:hypothetical protein
MVHSEAGVRWRPGAARRLTLLALLLTLPGFLATTARGPVPPKAGPRESPSAVPSPQPDEEAAAAAAGSPRESMASFLSLARAGDYEKAARYLVVAAAERERAPILTERLKAVPGSGAWDDAAADEADPGGLEDALRGRVHGVEAPAASPVRAG